MKRKLTAILRAEVQGYSRSMGRDIVGKNPTTKDEFSPIFGHPGDKNMKFRLNSLVKEEETS